MIRSNYDHSEGAHECIPKKLARTNLEQMPGYGEDHYCIEAADIIRGLRGWGDTAVHFPVGGTQANPTVIVSALHSHQEAVGAVAAHVSVHGTGFIEAVEYEVLALSSRDDRTTAEQVEEPYQAYVRDGSSEHVVQPKMIYISSPTEPGTICTRAEMENLYEVCGKYDPYLFVGSVHPAYNLTAEGNNLDLKSLATFCDVFYIRGAEVGTFLGEAMVMLNDELKTDFRYYIKQRGSTLVKGRLLGIQFGELLRDGLYFELGIYADRLADKICCACVKKGHPFPMENITNQVFLIMPDALLESWKDKYSYTNQEGVDESHIAIRLCTSWTISGEQVDILVNDTLDN